MRVRITKTDSSSESLELSSLFFSPFTGVPLTLVARDLAGGSGMLSPQVIKRSNLLGSLFFLPLLLSLSLSL
jgi:hypothetical protein